jgi:hypothetical protein
MSSAGAASRPSSAGGPFRFEWRGERPVTHDPVGPPARVLEAARGRGRARRAGRRRASRRSPLVSPPYGVFRRDCHDRREGAEFEGLGTRQDAPDIVGSLHAVPAAWHPRPVRLGGDGAKREPLPDRFEGLREGFVGLLSSRTRRQLGVVRGFLIIRFASPSTRAAGRIRVTNRTRKASSTTRGQLYPPTGWARGRLRSLPRPGRHQPHVDNPASRPAHTSP